MRRVFLADNGQYKIEEFRSLKLYMCKIKFFSKDDNVFRKYMDLDDT
jgi:hypothetical protein